MAHTHLIKFDRKDVDPNGLVSVRKAALLLDVSPKTIYGYISQGKLQAYKIGRNVRLKARDFLRWIDVHAKAS